MINILDLFCGCGGLSYGFKSNPNFNIICANDIWKDALETYKLNNPYIKTILGDISNPDIKNQIVKEFNNKECDLIIGGVPCQSFSIAGKRDINDPRGILFKDYIKLVELLNPKLCIIENVKGILSMKHYKDDLNEKYKLLEKDLKIKVIDKIIYAFKILGYKTEYKVLDCSLYGIPQKRERVIFIMSRLKNEIIFPLPNYQNIVTVRDAIDDLKNKKENKELSHLFSRHCKEMIEKIKNTKIGECMNKNYNDAFFKCDPDKPSRTIKENHGSVFLHYEKNRVMTPRELARLQSFQDDFLFYGSKTSILKQIGNAVPPLLSTHLASVVIQMYNNQ